ncbi:MAG: DNA integrity scanning diadenylate cyclase DisA [Bifidobacteriaceae bacterium]|jgi:diadenylate cyclase|nr:DNA integrity scanning diadenylate cyclase DisA [Bifidobacteriaceae bacterium]
MKTDEGMPELLKSLAPGTGIRYGLERIINTNTGALIVLGTNQKLEQISSGGFKLDTRFTAQKLRELAKMDGAIVISKDYNTIHYANVQLLPSIEYETHETGTRHKTADRVAQQTGLPTISISASMKTIMLYNGDIKRFISDPIVISERMTQAMQTLERYSGRFDENLSMLVASEIENSVHVRDVLIAAQRAEMLKKIATEIETGLIELGTESRLLSLQFQEIISDFDIKYKFLLLDYIAEGKDLDETMNALANLDEGGLLDIQVIADILGLQLGYDADDYIISPRGYRVLYGIFRTDDNSIYSIARHFNGLQNIISSGINELGEIIDVTPYKARIVREGLAKIVENAMYEPFI